MYKFYFHISVNLCIILILIIHDSIIRDLDLAGFSHKIYMTRLSTYTLLSCHPANTRQANRRYSHLTDRRLGRINTILCCAFTLPEESPSAGLHDRTTPP